MQEVGGEAVMLLVCPSWKDDEKTATN